MIDPIAKLRSPSGTLISLYVNRRSPGTRAALVDMLKRLRSEERDRSAEKAIRADTERILAEANRMDADPAPAFAIFASHLDGIFEFLPLSFTVGETATVGPRPLLRPLRAHPRPMRVGVVVADGSHARTYLASGGVFEELGEKLTTDPGKDNYGGFAGYEEQRIRSRAEELSAKLWRQAWRRLLEVHQDQPLELVIVAGHDEAFEDIAAQMHAYLQQLPQGRIVVDPHTLTRSELVDMVSAEIQRVRAAGERELLDRLVDEVEGNGAAVAGLASVLEGCNAHAIEHLVVAGSFAKDGVICDGCGYLARVGSDCPVCSSNLTAIDDVVAAAMESVIEAGGKASIVSAASRLDAVGVGGFTRFSVV